MGKNQVKIIFDSLERVLLKVSGEKTNRGSKHLGPLIIETSWVAIYRDMELGACIKACVKGIHKSYIIDKGLKMIKRGSHFKGRLHPLVQPYKKKFNCDVVVLYYNDRLLFRVDDTKELYICDELQGLYIQGKELVK